jgi:hypothetical protein
MPSNTSRHPGHKKVLNQQHFSITGMVEYMIFLNLDFFSLWVAVCERKTEGILMSFTCNLSDNRCGVLVISVIIDNFVPVTSYFLGFINNKLVIIGTCSKINAILI